MDLNHLLYFTKVARLQNITKAAEELSITQPALSRVIHNLEEELGYKFFDRQGKNIVLNKKGEIFLEFATHTFDALDQAKGAMKALDDHEQCSVNLAMRTSLCVLPVMVLGFKEIHPEISLNIVRNLGKEQDGGEVDVVIDTSIQRPEGENYDILVEESSNLLISKQLLAEYSSPVTLKAFEKETFFVLQGSVQKEITETACKNAGFTPRISTDFASSVTIHSFLESGLGVAIVPEKLWNYSAHPGLVMLNLPVNTGKKYTFIKCNTTKNQNVTAFRRYCIDFFHQLEAEGCRNYFETNLLKGTQVNE